MTRSSRVAVTMILAFNSAMVAPNAPACASGPSVSIVIRTDGSTEKQFCIEVDKEPLTGLGALRRTGLDIETRNFGGSLGMAVCTIDGIGSDLSDCPGRSGHWHYWHGVEGRWVEADKGASSSQVKDGSIEGWTWETTGDVTPPSTPPRMCEIPMATSSSSEPTKQSGVLVAGTSGGLVAIMLLLIRRSLVRRRTNEG